MNQNFQQIIKEMKFVSKIEMSNSDKDQGKKLATDEMEEKSSDFLQQESIEAQFISLDIDEIFQSYHQTQLNEQKLPESMENRSYKDELKQQQPEGSFMESQQQESSSLSQNDDECSLQNHALLKSNKTKSIRKKNPQKTSQILETIKGCFKNPKETAKGKTIKDKLDAQIRQKNVNIIFPESTSGQKLVECMLSQSSPIELLIDNLPFWDRFLARLVFMTVDSHTAKIIQDKIQIQIAGFMEKLIHSWKSFNQKKYIDKDQERKILNRLEALFSIENGKIRAQCKKNLPAFFARIIILLVQEYSEFHGNMNQIMQDLSEIHKEIKSNENENENEDLDEQKRVRYSIKKLKKAIQAIPEQIWKEAVTEVKVYQKIEVSSIKQKQILRMYYWCFVPRIFEIRSENPNLKPNVWKYNVSKTNQNDNEEKKKNDQKDKNKRDKERSFCTAGKYQESWEELITVQKTESVIQSIPDQHPNAEKGLEMGNGFSRGKDRDHLSH